MSNYCVKLYLIASQVNSALIQMLLIPQVKNESYPPPKKPAKKHSILATPWRRLRIHCCIFIRLCPSFSDYFYWGTCLLIINSCQFVFSPCGHSVRWSKIINAWTWYFIIISNHTAFALKWASGEFEYLVSGSQIVSRKDGKKNSYLINLYIVRITFLTSFNDVIVFCGRVVYLF